MSRGLEGFHPLVREWFEERYGSPTAVQAEAWPRIAAGEHVLALAPTGSGKTLTAFLGAISRLASLELPAEECTVLYVSPLKALGEDLRRNLEEPLAALKALFASRGAAFPDIRVATRTGDTSQAERRRMVSRPPSILVTTPESLCLILDSPIARQILAKVRLLILDEVHALCDSKRGSLLACAVGRLALLAGEFQRLALSATVRPPEAIAAFVGGRSVSWEGGQASWSVRPVSIVAPQSEKRIELRVEYPPAPEPGSPDAPAGGFVAEAEGSRYSALIPFMLGRIRSHSGTIVFTDSRRRAERIAFLLNEVGGEGTAWAHHGSLSREARRVVEERMRAGELACVVATASLELGIDIGGIDEVILAGAPPAVSSALQRIGRSGHGVGETSSGLILPFHGMDLLLAAAGARAVDERAVEESRPLSCPLDILAQVLLSLAVEAPRTAGALYDIVRSFPPFETLPRGLFDSTLEMLAGRYSSSRLRELEPRLSLDRGSAVVTARDGVRSLLYSSGGAIPDRGLYSLRVHGSRTRIGELDEEFVWERKVGDAFSFGAQAWRIVDIGSEAVEVVPLGREADFMPFWKAESRFRSPELATRCLELLDRLGPLGPEGAAAFLESGYHFSPEAALSLALFVDSQKTAGGGKASLPGSRLIVIEANADPARRGDAVRLLVHTLRGAAINETLALALAAAWEEEAGLPIQVLADDDSILALVPLVAEAEGGEPAAVAARLIAALSAPGRLEALLRSRLEGTGLFGAQFRENAGRALLLPRGLPGKRTPLWITRLRAKKLFEAVRGFSDFPVTVETWRSCLGDLLDLEGTRDLVSAVAEGRIGVSCFSSRSPSPFSREAVWKETNEFLYRGDALESRSSSSVSDQVVAEALRSSRLRPRLDPALVADFVGRLKRLVPGWSPESGLELAEWAKERVAIPVSELPGLLTLSPALAQAYEADPSCGGALLRMTLEGGSEALLVHAEFEQELRADPASLLPEWLRREGPVEPGRITELFGLDGARLDDLLDGLVEEGTIVVDVLLRGSEAEAVIDAQNLELLLRLGRKAARPRVEARPASDLLRLVSAVQGIGGGRELPAVLESLAGYPAPVALWESEILDARVPGYREAELDALAARGRWQWFGAGREIVAFARAEDLGLFLESAGTQAGGEGSRIIPEDSAGLDFWALRELSGGSAKEAALALWAEAWKGLVASDGPLALRQGLVNRFGAELGEPGPESELQAPVFGARRRIPRALRERWRGGAPVPGTWYRLDFEEEEGSEEADALEEAGLAAQRVRVLVGRYGMVCRSLLERELPALGWQLLFPALRRLELAGGLLAGRFFEGIDGPQFMGSEAFRIFMALDEEAPAEPVWLNALDPAASAAWAASERDALLPARLGANRVCFHKGRAVAVSTRSHRALVLAMEPRDPVLAAVFAHFARSRSRPVRPERRIVFETVNAEGAATSPYAAALRDAGFEPDRGRMVLW